MSDIFAKYLSKEEVSNLLYLKPEDSDPNAEPSVDLSFQAEPDPLIPLTTEQRLRNLEAKVNTIWTAQGILAQTQKDIKEVLTDHGAAISSVASNSNVPPMMRGVRF